MMEHLAETETRGGSVSEEFQDHQDSLDVMDLMDVMEFQGRHRG
jgi:hypothetical protein